MIGFLTGQPQLVHESVVITVNGVGYLVQVGPITKPSVLNQAEVSLYIHTHVKEDALELYGFETKHDYVVFQELLKVSGVGPRTALAIVDGRADQVVQAVQQAKTSFFSATPRVGKKLSQKIIIELRSKLGEMKELNLKPTSPQHQDLTEALLSLGVREDQIESAIEDIDVENQSLETSITQSLKKLGTNS